MSNEYDSSIVYTPTEVAKLVLSAVKERRDHPGAGVRSYVTPLDEVMLPMRPGELITVMGRQSNYKSGLMQYMARRVAEQIRNDEEAGEIVVYITWEMAVEELGLYDLAASTGISAVDISQGRIDDGSWEALELAAAKRSIVPLWLIGHSVERRKRRPDLTLTNIAKALQWVDSEMGVHPKIVFMDYLGQMQPEKGEDRRMQVFENVRRSKDMALALGCPVVLGVQAGRQMDGRQWKLPEAGDGQESSNIEQTADKMISVWMPKTSEPIGQPCPMPGQGMPEVMVTENLLVLGLKKQRLGPANRVMFCYVNPERNEIAPMQLT